MNESVPTNEELMLQMSPWDFDQSENGWRKLDKEGDLIGAANLLRTYISLNEEKIAGQKEEPKVDIQIMYFHVGQLLASVGQRHFSEALNFFTKGFYEREHESWNAYVSGTIGFLESDKDKIDAALDILGSSSKGKERVRISIMKNFQKALQEGEHDYAKVMSWPR